MEEQKVQERNEAVLDVDLRGERGSLRERCEFRREQFKGLFRASRLIGPRPDVVFRAMVRINMVEYRNANELLLGKLRGSLEFESGAADRSSCWEECEAERKRLVKFHRGFQYDNDESVLGVLRCELKLLYEPLPAPAQYL